MDLGVYLHGSSPFYPKETIAEYIELAKHYEQAGVDSLWFADHLIRTPDPHRTGLFETWSLIAGLSRETSTVKFGTMVTPVTFREFGVFAKMLSTIDQLSGGRLIAGLGTGWFAREHEMFGITMPSVADRFVMLEETLQCLQGLWTNRSFNFSGQTIQLRDAYLNPKPVEGSLPILIGGGGEKKTLRLVAEYGDYSNFGGDLGTIKHKLQVLKDHCSRMDRPFSQITPTTNRAIVLGKTEQEVRRGVDNYLQRFKEVGRSPPSRENFANTRLVGTIDQVIEQIQELDELGIEIINLTVNDYQTEQLIPALINSLV